ncbi:hypothetical protein KAU33_15405 [Candidatus Dependentiae bacterium]|nr:hypothetical protein [Candidatus Dependentiae bacterium]
MGRQFNWEKHGYETAKGKRGTGWMVFTDSDAENLIKEFPKSEYPDGIPIDEIDRHGDDWTETLQFEYEAGNRMIVWAKRKAKKEGDEENWVYGFSEKRAAWVMGYVTHIIEVLKKKGVEVDRYQ